MALTRKMLKAMGIEDEKIDQIIEEHVESIDGLKAERDRYKEGADEAEGLRKQLEEAKKAGEGAGEYEEKYKAKCKELDDFKEKVDGEAAEREKRGLYRELLAGAAVQVAFNFGNAVGSMVGGGMLNLSGMNYHFTALGGVPLAVIAVALLTIYSMRHETHTDALERMCEITV